MFKFPFQMVISKQLEPSYYLRSEEDEVSLNYTVFAQLSDGDQEFTSEPKEIDLYSRKHRKIAKLVSKTQKMSV
jgi:hypothetical protein